MRISAPADLPALTGFVYTHLVLLAVLGGQCFFFLWIGLVAGTRAGGRLEADLATVRRGRPRNIAVIVIARPGQGTT